MQQTLPNGIPSNDPSLPDLDTPLYVLVNSNTASAAEVLAAALKVQISTSLQRKMWSVAFVENEWFITKTGLVSYFTEYLYFEKIVEKLIYLGGVVCCVVSSYIVLYCVALCYFMLCCLRCVLCNVT